MTKVGIFAGAFDPIHEGHIQVACESVKWLDLDELVCMVEGKSWGSKKSAALHHRQAMVDLAVADLKKIGQLDTIPEKFTIEKTLPWLESEFPDTELYFIFGADVFIHMDEHRWPDLSRLLQHNIVVFERKDITEDRIADHAKTLGIAVAILPSAHPHHSSTSVRATIKGGHPMLPKAVARYIKENNLYS